ncbi:hypothetical protein BP6252_01461 [Coleophoma cylindrospora]|uniref:Uncharacterized protein n=1 Tax=Coleophoma cylindrospora TaxID=1849047 RepID=A0A3D8SSX8_9HELO|nr:hypothetical protein BP6252_01461 [Coleophoma cylindrospora]
MPSGWRTSACRKQHSFLWADMTWRPATTSGRSWHGSSSSSAAPADKRAESTASHIVSSIRHHTCTSVQRHEKGIVIPGFRTTSTILRRIALATEGSSLRQVPAASTALIGRHGRQGRY